MLCTVKGKFLEQGTFNTKKGGVTPYVNLLVGNREVVQISGYVPQKPPQLMEEILLPVSVVATQRGLWVRYYQV